MQYHRYTEVKRYCVSMGVHNSFVECSYQISIIQLQQDAKKYYIYFMPAVHMLREYDNISYRVRNRNQEKG